MKLKGNVSLEQVCERLKSELSTHINISIKSNPINKNIKWIEVNKDAFIGIKIFLKDNELLIDGHIPNIFARAYFGGFISGIFHRSIRQNFIAEISKFLISEFYTD